MKHILTITVTLEDEPEFDFNRTEDDIIDAVEDFLDSCDIENYEVDSSSEEA
jgi:hypothetical protein